MISNIQENDLIFLLIKKLKQYPVPLVDRKTPLFFELPVKTMRVKARVKHVAPEKSNVLIGKPLQLGIQILVTATIPRMEVNRHAAYAYASFANMPARRSFFASRDQRNTSCSVTGRPARAISSSSSFLGITTRSPLLASFLGIVMVAMRLLYHTVHYPPSSGSETAHFRLE
jgi:hypothetical protein